MSRDRSAALAILVVEDSEDDALLLQRRLEGAGYRVDAERVDTRAGLAAALARRRWDMVFSDFSMPKFSGLDALGVVREHDPDLPFVIVSGTIGEDRAVRLIKAGAQDYILKGRRQRLVPVVKRELRESARRRERRRAEERVRRLVYYDPVTDLPNRTRFLEQLARRLERGPRREALAVLTMDLTAYEEVSATLGYTAADSLLRQSAERLARLLPPGSVLSVSSAARFCAMLLRGDPDRAHALAERLQREFTRPFGVGGFRVSAGLCVGAAQFPDHGTGAELLLRRAAMALALARRNPSGYAAYDPRTDPSSPETLSLAPDLRDAVERGTLQLYFQPKINLTTRRPEGAEVLTRWPHPSRGMIPPDDFLPLAEKAGSLHALTLWLLGAAADQQCAWFDSPGREPIPLAVNLSARSLLDRRLVKRFQELFRDRRLRPGAIEVEITESALMEDPKHSLMALEQLHDLGIRIYLDDFGTGYSSLGYLKRLPIDAIKIDKSFVVDMTSNPHSRFIVRSTVELAHDLGLTVVAEGVEDRAALERLSAFGCDAVQGYLICRPLPPAEFLAWYRERAPVPAG